MGCLEENHGSAESPCPREPLFSIFRPSWWKAQERKGVGGKPGCRQSGQDGAWARYRFDPDAGFDGLPNQMTAGVRNRRSAGVRDEGDVIAALQPRDERRRLGDFVVFMQAG